jgi:hypothetical protein
VNEIQELHQRALTAQQEVHAEIATRPDTRGDGVQPGPITVTIGAALMMLASFLPWVTIRTGLGSLSKSGLEGDGIITLFLGISALTAGIFLLLKRGWSGTPWLIVLDGVLAFGLAWFDYNDISTDIRSLNTQFGQASVGIGVTLVFFAAAMLIVGGWMSRRRSQPQPKAEGLHPNELARQQAAARDRG